ncbi:GAD-like domain-containing protein [Agrobacterium larrymoorei]|uniref:DUF1851 domain-containing protein n=1 Tax=Agrobacterium larrymoorei TaxID=160699 RepID=A0ABX8T619_9HYPH|nr:GAD-like domain-containing protein [Agrobacterium larrymoorei]QYA08727.1 DUF1851 domain-containing protein [Agrobacterium larrymoorei]
MQKLFVTYQNALKRLGRPRNSEILGDADIARYKNRISETYLDFIRQAGFGTWNEGYFQFCDPEKYKSMIALDLSGDKQLKPDRTHALGFSPFGKILAWNEDYKTTEINTLLHRVIFLGLFKEIPAERSDINLGIAVEGTDAASFDAPDEYGKLMFNRLLKTLGKLQLGQIYSPKLHPSLGGQLTVENMRPVNALPAMTIAAQAGPFTLYDTTKPSTPAVRIIGS